MLMLLHCSLTGRTVVTERGRTGSGLGVPILVLAWFGRATYAVLRWDSSLEILVFVEDRWRFSSVFHCYFNNNKTKILLGLER